MTEPNSLQREIGGLTLHLARAPLKLALAASILALIASIAVLAGFLLTQVDRKRVSQSRYKKLRPKSIPSYLQRLHVVHLDFNTHSLIQRFLPDNAYRIRPAYFILPLLSLSVILALASLVTTFVTHAHSSTFNFAYWLVRGDIIDTYDSAISIWRPGCARWPCRM
jgi:hypothetical protein